MNASKTTSTIDFLTSLLEARLRADHPEAFQWLWSFSNLSPEISSSKIKTAFSLAPRKLPKQDLIPSNEEIGQSLEIDDCWNLASWSVDQAGRSLLLLWHSQVVSHEALQRDMKLLFETGEVRELVCLYQLLPFLPSPQDYLFFATEAIRSNMRPVFISLAHGNSYPAEYLDENSFNQLILKAIFTAVSIVPIAGIVKRSNLALTNMLCDYAHERWAAKRPVCPELWFPVGCHLTTLAQQDLHKVVQEGEELSITAAQFALSSSTDLLSWISISKVYWQNQNTG